METDEETTRKYYFEELDKQKRNKALAKEKLIMELTYMGIGVGIMLIAVALLDMVFA